MTLERWTAFVGVLLVVVFTPGPDFAVVLRHALARPARGVRAAAGTSPGSPRTPPPRRSASPRS